MSKIIGLAGSIRSNFKAIGMLQSILDKASIEDDLVSELRSCNKMFSNSDVALAFSLFAAKQKGAEVSIHSISNIFSRSDELLLLEAAEWQEDIVNIDFLSVDQKSLGELFYELKSCTGVILSSPVYFGDRSSMANKFMQLTNRNRLLNNKVFGMVAVGAKRNGGQETTCIYGLYDAMMQGAVIVGNGPITSQYGGTVVAGDKMASLDDEWGLQRCLELGRRINSMSNIIDSGSTSTTDRPLKITALMTMDTPKKRYRQIAEEYFSTIDSIHKVQFIDLIDDDIFRCIACDVCPPRSGALSSDGDYCCAVKSKRDSMREIVSKICDSDCIVIIGVNSHEQLAYNYQAFTERTRSLRRNDFMLNNVTVLGMLINEVGAINNPLHNVKVLTSYIRHNTQMMKPIEIVMFNDGSKQCSNPFSNYISMLSMIASGRERSTPEEISYKATGYANKSLDHTSKSRR